MMSSFPAPMRISIADAGKTIEKRMNFIMLLGRDLR